MGWMYAWGESSLVPLVPDAAWSRAEASTSDNDGMSRFTEEMLCAGGTSSGQVCSAEHGGPLTVEVDGHHIVAGVSSWGLGCGQDGRQFAVYAEVAQVRTWIDETIATSGGATPCNSTSAWNSTATWGSWGSWSECSQSCDDGHKVRERQCLYEDGVVADSSRCNQCETGDISCLDGSIEYERCNEGSCSGTTGGSNTGSKGYTQAWLRGPGDFVAHVHEGLELADASGFVAVGETSDESNFGAILVTRVDTEANKVWSQKIGTQLSAAHTVVESGSNVIVGGGLYSASTGKMQATLIALDSATGSTVWTKSLDHSGHD